MGKHSKGYTLLELVVVMAIFTVIMVMTSKAFDNLLSTGSQQSKTAVGQIEGIVGLEMLRKDVSHAGYGLFWSFPTGITPDYSEPATLPAAVNGIAASDVRENPPTLPRPVQVLASTYDAAVPCSGSDYLVLRGAELALSSANSSVGRWGPLEYVGGSTTASIRRLDDLDSDVRSTDRVVSIATSFNSSGQQTKRLMAADSATFSYAPPAVTFIPPAGFQPTDPTPSYVVYGIANNTGIQLRMPYNRADFYLSRPADVSNSCNPGTGVLYKAVTNQDTTASGSNTFTTYPLLNCVGDFRVVFEMGGGTSTIPAGTFIPGNSPQIAALTTTQLRDEVKSATVYVLSHEGGKEQGYTYPPIDSTNALFLGPYVGSTPLSSGRMWTRTEMAQRFGSDWQKYRWKVYSIPVSLKNLRD